MQSETSRLVLNELERCENLSATEIQEFVSRLRQAIRREYQAQAVRLKRQNLSTNLSTMHKEERSEKENLPPTPPIREKANAEHSRQRPKSSDALQRNIDKRYSPLLVFQVVEDGEMSESSSEELLHRSRKRDIVRNQRLSPRHGRLSEACCLE